MPCFLRRMARYYARVLCGIIARGDIEGIVFSVCGAKSTAASPGTRRRRGPTSRGRSWVGRLSRGEVPEAGAPTRARRACLDPGSPPPAGPPVPGRPVTPGRRGQRLARAPSSELADFMHSGDPNSPPGDLRAGGGRRLEAASGGARHHRAFPGLRPRRAPRMPPRLPAPPPPRRTASPVAK